MVATSEVIYDVTHRTFVDQLEETVSLDRVVELTGKNPRTLIVYRKMAYELVVDYRDSCTERYPRYPLDLKAVQIRINFGERPKPIYPDPPPFTRVEARILVGISKIFDDLNDKGLVITRIQRNPYFWAKIRI
ncbi:hypothetical protein [Brasilonema sp. UFV-L1]|uniref:hypothetical protein n=1 Tax=Brasilonema sp. UFV-L1 TaxID=2234130 RepID=UPI00145E60BB|nr:hypothetical protein [Brasilonema sp. UFV-L1]NMG11861.1 hypothetical protein [Brasilonema sp. UFV-L1]